MFTVRVAVRTRPDRREPFMSQLKKEEREVPTRFEGCTRFAVYNDPSDPDSTFIYEEWSTKDAFDRYRSSEYFNDSGKILLPLIDGAPDSAYYESERVGP